MSPKPPSQFRPGSSRSTASAIHYENDKFRALPANVTFHDLIRANKRKSAMLMIAMVLLLIVVGAVIGGAITAWGGGGAEALIPAAAVGAVVAGLLGVFGAIWSLSSGANAVLRMAGAVPIEHKDDPQLFNVVEELSIAAGIPLPKIYVINNQSLNAFATGRDPEHGVVAITAGLRAHLSRDELAAVMAHEITHIRNYDIRFAMLMATMVGLIVFACDAFLRIMWYGAWTGAGHRRRSSKSEGGNPAALIFLVLGILLAIIAPTLALVIRFAVSREREYLADAGAVELTRYPQGMIDALEKLGSCKQPFERASRATAHMFIVNPMKNAMRGQGHELNSVFRTHPPLHDRIARLKKLMY